jgi:hypothetical protein
MYSYKNKKYKECFMKSLANSLETSSKARRASHQRCAVPLLITALIAVIGLSLAACGPTEENVSTSGRLTIIGIPSTLNGKQIRAEAYIATSPDDGRALYAGAKATNMHYLSGDTQAEALHKDTVSSTQIELKVFTNGPHGIYKGYNGNDQNVKFDVHFFEENGTTRIYFQGSRYDEIMGTIPYSFSYIVTVNFTNGVGSGILTSQ